jgi:hypothetical protein
MAEERALVRVFATLNLVAGALAVWGGAEEVLSSPWQVSLGFLIGFCGALTGVLLFASGGALWSGKGRGRRIAQWAGWSSIIVAGVGVAAGTMGKGGLAYWVVYPAIMIAYLRRRPGVPGSLSRVEGNGSEAAADDKGLRRRTALA